MRAAASDAMPAPMSAARLAAEAAFGAPLQVRPPVLQAQVTVRKARPLDPSDEPGTAESSPASTEGATEPSTKAPRIFRVDAVRLADPADTPAAEAARSSPAPADNDPPAASVAPRRRRVSPDKRPGPVLHVVQAVPVRKEPQADPLELAGGRAASSRGTPGPATMTNPPAPVFINQRFAAEWQSLSRRVDDLHRQLKARLR